MWPLHSRHIVKGASTQICQNQDVLSCSAESLEVFQVSKAWSSSQVRDRHRNDRERKQKNVSVSENVETEYLNAAAVQSQCVLCPKLLAYICKIKCLHRQTLFCLVIFPTASLFFPFFFWGGGGGGSGTMQLNMN